MTTYRVTYEHDGDGWWVASVDGVPGCHTQGRTIARTRTRLREALALFVPHAESAVFRERIRVTTAVKKALATWFEVRRREEALRGELKKVQVGAVRGLVLGLGVSVRDAGDILDISHQRVHQLAAKVKRDRRPRKSSPQATFDLRRPR